MHKKNTSLSSKKRNNMITFVLIGMTILFTVTGQLLVKSGMMKVGSFPTDFKAASGFLWRSITNWKVILGLFCAAVAALTWMGAVSLSNISFAYPFMALAIVLVLVLSPILFHETVKWNNWVGVLVVCIGLIISTR